jgi:hypothetical protein
LQMAQWFNIDNQRSITVCVHAHPCMREQPYVQGLGVTACLFLLECYKVFAVQQPLPRRCASWIETPCPCSMLRSRSPACSGGREQAANQHHAAPCAWCSAAPSSVCSAAQAAATCTINQL